MLRHDFVNALWRSRIKGRAIVGLLLRAQMTKDGRLLDESSCRYTSNRGISTYPTGLRISNLNRTLRRRRRRRCDQLPAVELLLL